MKRILKRISAMALALSAACAHDSPFATVQQHLGPMRGGADVQLTYNVEQDAWPVWTEDDRGLLYTFVPENSPNHRCLGLLPPDGGTRFWQFCDDRPTRDDTVSSFGGYALGANGRLLYAETVARRPLSFSFPPITRLWLADSAHPVTRRLLATLPVTPAGTGIQVTWLAELAWTGPDRFLALGQQLATRQRPCPRPPAPCITDTLFTDAGVVISGTITGADVVFTAIAGTNGATAYSLAESGASIVFTRAGDQQLLKVPVTGGTAVAVATVTALPGEQLLGVSCRNQICAVAIDPIVLGGLLPFPSVTPNVARALFAVSLTDGAVHILIGRGTGEIFASPLIAPNLQDVIAQVGGTWGHLQTASPDAGNLHRFNGLLP